MSSLVAVEDRIHSESVGLPFHSLVVALRRILGARLVAYLGGVKETRAVNQWSDGTRQPSDEMQERLRAAYQAADLLVECGEHEKVAQSWFQGMNPRLDDFSPARMLREKPLPEAGPAVIAAARAYLARA